jgi:hypothetical protein
MPARKPRPKDEKPQFERFVETVRQVGADETDETLDRVIRKIAAPRKVMPVMPPRSKKPTAS